MSVWRVFGCICIGVFGWWYVCWCGDFYLKGLL